MKINDELVFMARMLDKMKQDLHEIQHLEISLTDYEGLKRSANNLTDIAYTIHLMAENFAEKYQPILPKIDLQQVKNNELIQRLQYFRDHGE